MTKGIRLHLGGAGGDEQWVGPETLPKRCGRVPQEGYVRRKGSVWGTAETCHFVTHVPELNT